MKLSTLYTESLNEASNPFKNLIHNASRAFSKSKTTPNLKIAKIKKIIDEVYQEVWGDYHNDSKALPRIDAYRHSIERHIPELLRIQSESDLRDQIEAMFRNRVSRSSKVFNVGK